MGKLLKAIVLQGILVVFWLAMIPIALKTGLKDSLPFVVFVSLYANFVGHVSAFEAARAKYAADKGNK